MSHEDKRRLTKVERDLHRNRALDYRDVDCMDAIDLLDDLDSADEENTRHRYVIEELAEANSVLARENERLHTALKRITYEVIDADVDAMGVVRRVNDIAEVALDGDND